MIILRLGNFCLVTRREPIVDSKPVLLIFESLAGCRPIATLRHTPWEVVAEGICKSFWPKDL